MWSPTLPAEPRSDRWWHDRWIYEQEAAVAADRRAAEQDKRRRQLRRRVERVDESTVLALSASDARRTFRKHGIPYERSARLGPIEHSRHGGQILRAW
jgi:hypothetical protein